MKQFRILMVFVLVDATLAEMKMYNLTLQPFVPIKDFPGVTGSISSNDIIFHTDKGCLPYEVQTLVTLRALNKLDHFKFLVKHFPLKVAKEEVATGKAPHLNRLLVSYRSDPKADWKLVGNESFFGDNSYHTGLHIYVTVIPFKIIFVTAPRSFAKEPLFLNLFPYNITAFSYSENGEFEDLKRFPGELAPMSDNFATKITMSTESSEEGKIAKANIADNELLKERYQKMAEDGLASQAEIEAQMKAIKELLKSLYGTNEDDTLEGVGVYNDGGINYDELNKNKKTETKKTEGEGGDDNADTASCSERPGGSSFCFLATAGAAIFIIMKISGGQDI